MSFFRTSVQFLQDLPFLFFRMARLGWPLSLRGLVRYIPFVGKTFAKALKTNSELFVQSLYEHFWSISLTLPPLIIFLPAFPFHFRNYDKMLEISKRHSYAGEKPNITKARVSK